MEPTNGFLVALLQIILINIVLSGDNAVVIALACRSLPRRQQRMGIFLGAGAAVVLRLIFTAFVLYLMEVPYLKIVGGLLLFWIGYKLMLPEDGHDGEGVGTAGSLWAAIRIILVADVVMSLDNVVAVAAAAKGDFILLVLGLAISIPLVVFGSQIMLTVMGRFPVIITLGGALIGYIGGDIMVSDPAIAGWINLRAPWLHVAMPVAGVAGVVLSGKIAGGRMTRRRIAAREIQLVKD